MLRAPIWIKLHSRWLRLHVRHTIAVALVLATGFCIFWFFWIAWTEIGGPDVAISLRSLSIHSLQTSVMLDTFDPDNLTVTAHISTTLNDPVALQFDPLVAEQIPELKSLPETLPTSEYSVYYAGPHVSDLAPIFKYFGTRLIFQNVENVERRKPMTYSDFFDLKKSLEEKPPSDTTSLLTMIGDPRTFPFDRYLILYEGTGGAYLEYKGKVAYVDSAFTIAPRFPGFVVRELTVPELRGYDGILGSKSDLLAAAENRRNSIPFNPEFWYRSGFAISVERPLYLRIMTIVLGVIAVISVFIVSFRSEPSTYLLNAVGTFVALWGVRSIITASAPKTPNFVDFGVLTLFVLQIVIGLVRFLVKGRKKSQTLEPV